MDNKYIYIKMAKIWAEKSKAIRKKVGCIIVKDNKIISDGYNGMPHNFPDKCEETIYYKESDTCDSYTKPEVLHAESNAITKLAKSTETSKNSTLYATTAPCFECAKLIIQCEISKVFYLNKYKNDDGIKLLKKAKIKIEKIK